MTATLRKSPQSPMNHDKICDGRINYAKMKNEGGNCSQSVCDEQSAPSSASIDQSEALSRADGNNAHPNLSDEETCTSDPLVRKESAIMTDYDDIGVVDTIELDQELDQAFKNTSKKSVEIDIDKYQAYLDDPNLSDEERKELAILIWQIMMAFVDLGFGVHPVQQACGKTSETPDKTGNRDSSMLSSTPTTLSDKFNSIAAE